MDKAAEETKRSDRELVEALFKTLKQADGLIEELVELDTPLADAAVEATGQRVWFALEGLVKATDESDRAHEREQPQ